jgi:hypothetical protein
MKNIQLLGEVTVFFSSTMVYRKGLYHYLFCAHMYCSLSSLFEKECTVAWGMLAGYNLHMTPIIYIIYVTVFAKRDHLEQNKFFNFLVSNRSLQCKE